jgi:hypothetical protein
MKGLMFAALSVLLVSTTSIAAPQSTFARTAQVRLNEISSPIITDSGVLGKNFFMQLNTGSLPLKDLSIKLPQQQMGRLGSITIIDQSGKQYQTEIQTKGDQALITFAQAIQPNSNLRIRWNGVNQQLFMGDTLNYGISAGQIGLRERIMIGSARIQIPYL